jgi:hypothetical protein
VDELCGLLGYSEIFFFDFLTLEDGAARLSRNVGTELPLAAVQYPRRVQASAFCMVDVALSFTSC